MKFFALSLFLATALAVPHYPPVPAPAPRPSSSSAANPGPSIAPSAPGPAASAPSKPVLLAGPNAAQPNCALQSVQTVTQTQLVTVTAQDNKPTPEPRNNQHGGRGNSGHEVKHNNGRPGNHNNHNGGHNNHPNFPFPPPRGGNSPPKFTTRRASTSVQSSTTRRQNGQQQTSTSSAPAPTQTKGGNNGNGNNNGNNNGGQQNGGQNNGNNGGQQNGGQNGGNNNGGQNGGNNNNDPQSSLTLLQNQVQTNLFKDGQEQPTEGQVPSATSRNNFINFCATQNVPLTNGLQIEGGSCNPTPMGRIIAKNKTPTSKFVFPLNLSKIKANQAFTIKMAIKNVETGNFVNPNTNYYAAPAQVNGQGIVIGHSHIVAEKIPSLQSTQPTDPTVFAFFKGVNGKAVDGVLSADVANGLPAGIYRLSSINAAMNHQPILGAVAQRGAIDDAIYFTVE